MVLNSFVSAKHNDAIWPKRVLARRRWPNKHKSDGYESIGVLGTPRHGKRFIEIIMESKRIEKFRIQKVFNPKILEIMKHGRCSWWGNGDKDRDEIMRYLKWLKPENYDGR